MFYSSVVLFNFSTKHKKLKFVLKTKYFLIEGDTEHSRKLISSNNKRFSKDAITGNENLSCSRRLLK